MFQNYVTLRVKIALKQHSRRLPLAALCALNATRTPESQREIRGSVQSPFLKPVDAYCSLARDGEHLVQYMTCTTRVPVWSLCTYVHVCVDLNHMACMDYRPPRRFCFCLDSGKHFRFLCNCYCFLVRYRIVQYSQSKLNTLCMLITVEVHYAKNCTHANRLSKFPSALFTLNKLKDGWLGFDCLYCRAQPQTSQVFLVGSVRFGKLEA